MVKVVGVGCPERVVGGGGVNSILHFQFERGGDGDEMLPKDEAEAASSSWLYAKET
jgi:hypothetical protein